MGVLEIGSDDSDPFCFTRIRMTIGTDIEDVQQVELILFQGIVLHDVTWEEGPVSLSYSDVAD